MEKVRAGNSDAHATDWRLARYALILVGAIAVAVLIVAGAALLNAIDGPECNGEFPVCTTPSQQSARQSLAMLCGLGALAYFLAALPLSRQGDSTGCTSSSVWSSPSLFWFCSRILFRTCARKPAATNGS